MERSSIRKQVSTRSGMNLRQDFTQGICVIFLAYKFLERVCISGRLSWSKEAKKRSEVPASNRFSLTSLVRPANQPSASALRPVHDIISISFLTSSSATPRFSPAGEFFRLLLSRHSVTWRRRALNDDPLENLRVTWNWRSA